MALVFNRGKDESTFIDATMWGERAEKLAQHLTKGKQICATLDNVHFKAYTKRDGQPGGTLVATLQSLDFTRGQKQQASESQPQVPKSPMQVIQDMDPDLPF
jgi:single-strand DNA-binding protein